jgi:hypothetical protein
LCFKLFDSGLGRLKLCPRYGFSQFSFKLLYSRLQLLKLTFRDGPGKFPFKFFNGLPSLLLPPFARIEIVTLIQRVTSETAITVTWATTLGYTVENTVLRTVTANPVTVTQTLTGLITSTIYSPTVTTTVEGTANHIPKPAGNLIILIGSDVVLCSG